ARRQPGYHLTQLAMLLDEKLDIVGPRRAARSAPEPVAARASKRVAAIAGQQPPHDGLPVRGVNDELADVVPARPGPPLGQRGADAADRSAQRRSVPRAAVEGFVDEGDENVERRHAMPVVTSYHGIEGYLCGVVTCQVHFDGYYALRSLR